MNEFDVVITNWWSGNTEVEIVEEESIERLIAILRFRFEGLREKVWNSDTEVELESEEAWVRIFQKQSSGVQTLQKRVCTLEVSDSGENGVIIFQLRITNGYNPGLLTVFQGFISPSRGGKFIFPSQKLRCKLEASILTKALILVKSNIYYLYKTNRQTNKGVNRESEVNRLQAFNQVAGRVLDRQGLGNRNGLRLELPLLANGVRPRWGAAGRAHSRTAGDLSDDD